MRQLDPAAERTPIENPFTDLPDYHCFFCSPDPASPKGLKLTFYRVGQDAIETRAVPPHELGGFPRIAHAGFVTALLDELAWWACLALAGRVMLTAGMEIEFKRPLWTGQPVRGRAWIDAIQPEARSGSARVTATLAPDDGDERERPIIARARVRCTFPSAQLFCRLLAFDGLPASFRPFFPDRAC